VEEFVISLEQLDALIASRITAEAPKTRIRAERAHAELIMASEGAQGDSPGTAPSPRRRVA
jgi:hypothetical protein